MHFRVPIFPVMPFAPRPTCTERFSWNPKPRGTATLGFWKVQKFTRGSGMLKNHGTFHIVILKSSLVYDFSECSISMYDLDVGFRWNLDTRVA